MPQTIQLIIQKLKGKENKQENFLLKPLFKLKEGEGKETEQRNCREMLEKTGR